MTEPALDVVTKAMLDLSQCLCQAVRDHPQLTPLCFCGVLPGAAVVDDYVTLDSPDCRDRDGQGWVRLITAYPSAKFPNPQVTPSDCRSAAPLAVNLEVGIRRFGPQMTQQGGTLVPPEAAEMFTATRNQMIEMNLMRAAILCCFEARVVLQNYSPYGPIGGVIGGSWQVSVDMSDRDDD